jgi:hypothetical protein
LVTARGKVKRIALCLAPALDLGEPRQNLSPARDREVLGHLALRFEALPNRVPLRFSDPPVGHKLPLVHYPGEIAKCKAVAHLKALFGLSA